MTNQLKRTITIIAAVTAMAAMQYTAQAVIVLSGTATWVTGANALNINYSVDQGGGGFTYTYVLSTVPAVGLTSFTVKTPVTAGITAITGGDSGNGKGAATVFWLWNDDVNSATVSFVSPFGPSLNGGAAQDDGVAWNSTSTSLIPTPVPEASTVLSAALLLLPLGASTLRILRKKQQA